LKSSAANERPDLRIFYTPFLGGMGGSAAIPRLMNLNFGLISLIFMGRTPCDSPENPKSQGCAKITHSSLYFF
jgi:hypothetical protein